jgi:transcriptional regulator with XRE-family HTH domain
MVELGHRIRALREERRMTQQALAAAAGIATDMVSRLENGHYTSPGLRTLVRMADGLGLSVSALLPDAPGPSGTSPEAVMMARLGAAARRASRDELELIVELASTVAGRRRDGGSRS